MSRGKADFKARREQLGLTQQDVAQALTVNVKTVKNWENPRQTRYRISDAAWEYLDRAADMQAQQVAYARSVIEAQSEALAGNTVVVPITYYRDQATYDRFGREAALSVRQTRMHVPSQASWSAWASKSSSAIRMMARSRPPAAIIDFKSRRWASPHLEENAHFQIAARPKAASL